MGVYYKSIINIGRKSNNKQISITIYSEITFYKI